MEHSPILQASAAVEAAERFPPTDIGIVPMSAVACALGDFNRDQLGSTIEVLIALFVGIWCERWLAYGGSLIVDLDKASLSVSMRQDLWRCLHGERDQRSWHDGWHVGRWRELSDWFGVPDGLHETIVDHVAEDGLDYGPGHKAMLRSAAHLTWQGPGKLSGEMAD